MAEGRPAVRARYEYAAVVRAEMGPEEIEGVLNGMAGDGWRLAAVCQSCGTTSMFVMERERPDRP